MRLQEVLSDLERPPLGKASGKGVRRTLSEGAAPRGQGFWLSFQGDNGASHAKCRWNRPKTIKT